MSTRKPVLSYCRPRFGMRVLFARLWMTAANSLPRAEARGLHLFWTTRRARAVGVALAALAVSIPAVAQPPPGAPPRDRSGRSVLPVIGTSSISGSVTDAATGLPLARAVVSVYCPTCGTRAVRPIATDTDTQGRYELVGLPDGLYTVTAWTRAHQSQQYGSLAGRPGSGRRVPVGNGERVRRIDIAMTRGAVLTGRVTDPDGEPVPNVAVMVYSATRSLQAGRRYMVHRQSPTDDLGQFRFSNMPPGTYLVAADPQLSRPLADNVIWQGGQHDDLVMTFAPGSPGTAGAQQLTLDVGQQAAIDIQLLTGRLVTIGGRVLDSRGNPLQRGAVMLIPEDEDAVRDSRGNTLVHDGSFQMRSVRPGSYTMYVRAQPQPSPTPSTVLSAQDMADVESVAVPLLVGDADDIHITITTGPPSSASGHLVIEGDRAALRAALRGHTLTVSGWTHQLERMAGLSPHGQVRDDGTVQVKGLRGHQVVRVSGLPDGWWVKDVRVNGQDAVLGFDFGVGHHFTGLEIVVSDRPPTLGGRVRTPTGAPAVDVVVVAIPENVETFDGFFIAGLGGTTRTDQHGAYRFTGIRPGTYHVIAQDTQYLPATFFGDLDALRDLAARATAVTVSESDQGQLDLTVAVP